MKRFIITLSSIFIIFGAFFYFVSIHHEWLPQPFRVALYSMLLGFILAMAVYHIYLFAFMSKEPAYLLYSVFTFLIVARFATAPGGIAEIAAPGHTVVIYHLSETILPLFNIFGLWFSHETLRIQWGRLPTRAIYVVTIGLSIVMAAITGRSVGTWWYAPAMIPHIFVIIKGFRSSYCRSNPYALLCICVQCVFCVMPLAMLTLVMKSLYMPVVPLWLLLVLVQAVLLSQSYGEAKRREKELAVEKSLLESLNRTKSEFFGNISHEMKTPLTVIVTDMELTERFINEGNLETAKELIHEAIRETMRTANLVTDALAFARGQEVSKPMTRFDLGDVIKTTIAVFEPLVQKQSNILRQKIEELPLISGNASMLSDALINLLFNANRHTENGIINVNWKMEKDKLCLTVRDNGTGIPPEMLPRVFERGVTDGSGTGLGLAIVKSIMELHGGEVTIESEIGKGTAVMLAFPAPAEERI